MLEHRPAERVRRLAGVRWRGIAFVLLAATFGAHADDRRAASHDDRDHDRARAAVQAGEVLPWPTVFDRLQRTHPGQVLDLELEREDGRWIYEVRLLQADGRLLKLEVDARTADIIQVRHKDRHDRRRPESGRP
ncbi:PepSY domain-containing protein [Rhizobacter sp. LjRoot28]|uniref:PepSY domain-containing protein n=1 Tax=Rhizobacter sp. LjRoot28 TaxID=3342309 RepID=UPI003ECE4AEA